MAGTPSASFDGTGLCASVAPVPSLFWLSAVAILACLAAGLSLDGPGITLLAAATMLAGGLPHGAFDIALAMRALRLGRTAAMIVVCLYLLVAIVMLLTWHAAPLGALALFLVMSAFHFGEDWAMLEEGLLRAMAGASVICAACVGQPEEVAQLFNLLAGDPHGAVLARLGIVMAPLAFMVTGVGLIMAWQQGCRQWVMAQATALACLVLAPPVVGFATFFVLLHAPRHMRSIVRELGDWPRRQRQLCGGVLTVVCCAGLLFFERGFLSGDALLASKDTFRLLSIVAAPHLLLSICIERFVTRSASDLPRS